MCILVHAQTHVHDNACARTCVHSRIRSCACACLLTPLHNWYYRLYALLYSKHT